jgi:hypothetical protein
MMQECLISPSWFGAAVKLVDHWQTLTAGLLAIVAAAIGFAAIWLQTSKTEKMTIAAIERQHNAIRCVMPMTLAETHTNCKSMAENIANLLECIVKNDDESEYLAHSFPSLKWDAENIKSYRLFVETFTDHSKRKYISELVGSIQILSARYETFDIRNTIGESAIIDILIYCGKVSFLNSELYNYCRYADNNFPTLESFGSNSDIWDIIREFSLGFVLLRNDIEIFHSRINKLIDSNKAHDVIPWNVRFR